MPPVPLKPCPFCGCPTVLFLPRAVHKRYSKHIAGWMVACQCCGAQINWDDSTDWRTIAEIEVEAATKWNSRTRPEEFEAEHRRPTKAERQALRQATIDTKRRISEAATRRAAMRATNAPDTSSQ